MRRQHPRRRHAHRQDRGLGVFGECELILGAGEAKASQRGAVRTGSRKRGVRLVECGARFRKGIDEGLAHADLL
jgi:hypothetical protein